MTLSALFKKQCIFSELIARLIWEVRDLGFLVTLGEAWRSPETAALMAKEKKGIANSLHCLRLAQDLNVFKEDGTELISVDDYRPIGTLWKSYSTLSDVVAWGGDFLPSPDADHFSMPFNGYK